MTDKMSVRRYLVTFRNLRTRVVHVEQIRTTSTGPGDIQLEGSAAFTRYLAERKILGQAPLWTFVSYVEVPDTLYTTPHVDGGTNG